MSTTTTHATGMFCWAELATPDPEAAKKFYQGLFGWVPEDSPMGGGETYTMLRKKGREVSGLYRQHQESVVPGLGPNWLPYVNVENADLTAAKVKQAGGMLLAEPFDVMDLGRMAVCQDPTTGTFALWQARKYSGAGIVNESGAMCWNELITTDAAKARAFYESVFGWSGEQRRMPEGTYTIFKHHGLSAAGMMQARPEMKLTHPYWMVYFAVDDCDQVAGRARQLGGQIKMPPTDIPEVGRFAVLADPQGAYFSIFKGEPDGNRA